MKLLTLDNKEFLIKACDEFQPSKLQQDAIDLLGTMFPSVVLMHEVSIKVYSRKPKQRLDIFLPFYKIAIEVHGGQHEKYVPFFHGPHKKDFLKSQNKDRLKAQWCAHNNIQLVELFYDESRDKWEQKLNKAIRGDRKQSLGI